MKIEVSIEKDGKGDKEEKMMSPEQMRRAQAMQIKVAKMLARMAGRPSPNEVDNEIAAEFVEENMESKKAT